MQLIGHQYPSLGGRERDRPVQPVKTIVQCGCTSKQLNTNVDSPAQWAWHREFPEISGKHCCGEVINGTPGSRSVARGSRRPVGLGQTIADRASLCPANNQPGEAKVCKMGREQEVVSADYTMQQN